MRANWVSVWCALFTVGVCDIARAGDDFSHAVPSFYDSRDKSVAVVPVDFDFEDLSLNLDVTNRRATGTANIVFTAGPTTGYPMMDLFADALRISLDGKALDPILFARVIPPGAPAAVRVLRQKVEANSRHQLEIQYLIPKEKVTFSTTGVSLGFFMDDVTEERSFLERYAPSNFEFDHFTLEISVEVTGSNRKHRVFANGRILEINPLSWRVMYPAYYTTSSFYLHVTERPLDVQKGVLKGVSADVPFTVYADARTLALKTFQAVPPAFSDLEKTFGAFAHDTLTVYATPGNGGMEHCGATVTGYSALKHELAHSWFGRGVMPSGGNAGWIDESIVTWIEYGFSKNNVALENLLGNLANFSPFRRTTPEAAYTSGAEMLSTLEYRLGGTRDGLRGTLHRLYDLKKYEVIDTKEFLAFVENDSGQKFTDLFNAGIFGRSDRAAVRSGIRHFGSSHPMPFDAAAQVSLR